MDVSRKYMCEFINRLNFSLAQVAEKSLHKLFNCDVQVTVHRDKIF